LEHSDADIKQLMEDKCNKANEVTDAAGRIALTISLEEDLS
jgi:hypothetical protein